jgi:predicted RNase H-like HicB family nuclease
MVLEWDPRDGIYIATVPELPGCRTHGATLEEAVKNGREAMELWIDSARKWGDPIPQPRFFAPAIVDAPSEEPVPVG